MKTICHRINFHDQNNIKQIPKCLEKGLDFFEIDIQLCKDGLVVFHDYTLESKGVDKKILDLTVSELGVYNILSIDDLFKILKKHNNLHIILDVKGYNERIIGILYKKLIEYNNTSNTTFYIQSFNHYIIDLLKKFLGNHKKSIKYGYLISGFMNIYWDVYTKNIDYVCIDNEFVFKYLDKLDKPIYLYNCNSVNQLNCSIEYIEGIITDFPDNFKKD
tara:strand:- start:2942 stop:3595 length:654 start_codon:yes stop_codon:yes gene_type:complete